MKKLDQNPSIARQEIIVLGKLTPEEMKIIWQRKSEVNKVGFSYQLAFVKIHNYFPTIGNGKFSTDLAGFYTIVVNTLFK